jgi:hypothetical protein
MTDIVERLIAYRDRPGRSRDGRDLLADACNEIIKQRREITSLTAAIQHTDDLISHMRELAEQIRERATKLLKL